MMSLQGIDATTSQTNAEILIKNYHYFRECVDRTYTVWPKVDTWPQTDDIILAVMTGDEVGIEAAGLTAEIKECMYAIAVGNGFEAFMPKLKDKSDIAMCFAAHEGSLERVKNLYPTVQSIKALSIAGSRQSTAYAIVLQRAAEAGSLEIIQFLYNQEYPIELQYALFPAAVKGHLPIVNFVMSELKHQMKYARSYEMALEYAAKNGYLNIVNILLAQVGQFISKFSKEEALFLACQNGHAAVVRSILTKEPSLNVTDKQMLREATIKGYADVVQSLLELKGNEIPTSEVKTAMDWAVRKGHLSVVKCILDLKEDFSGVLISIVFQQAAIYGHLNIVQYLLVQAGDKLSADTKVQAIVNAHNNSHPEIAKAIESGVSSKEILVKILADLRQGMQESALVVITFLKHKIDIDEKKDLLHVLTSTPKVMSAQDCVLKHLLLHTSQDFERKIIKQAFINCALLGHISRASLFINVLTSEEKMDLMGAAIEQGATVIEEILAPTLTDDERVIVEQVSKPAKRPRPP